VGDLLPDLLGEGHAPVAGEVLEDAEEHAAQLLAAVLDPVLVCDEVRLPELGLEGGGLAGLVAVWGTRARATRACGSRRPPPTRPAVGGRANV
jgi:hypothetical protein